MANSATEVLRAFVPSVGLTLKVRGTIEGKQAAYAKRMADDGRAEDLEVDYLSNVDWKCSFDGGETHVNCAANAKHRATPVFFESKYFFRGDFKNPPKEIADIQINHRLVSVRDCFSYEEGVLVGSLDFINEPGKFRLELRIVYKDETWTVVSFEFLVVSVKMNILRDYDEILKTIEAARPSIAKSFLEKSFWSAALDGVNKDDDTTWYQILSDVFAYYVRSCKRIVNNPHQRYVRVDEYRRADRIKRWTPDLSRQFNRLSESQRAHTMLHGERVEGAIDTPENRFVLYTLKELARRLNRFADDQEKVKLVNPDWIKGVRQMASELLCLSRNPFFSGVGLFAGFRQQSLVMQKQAGYSQVFTVWNKLKRALKPGGDDVDVSYRPISMLYEFWCFLKMREMLDELLGVDGKVEMGSATEADLLETPELDDESKVDENKLGKESVVYEKDGVTYTLTYQKTYGVRDIDGLDNEAFSSLNPQRPDIVLTIAADGNMYSYLFDAKYRIWSMPGQGQKLPAGGPRVDADATTRDAMDAMYRYRDAILYRLQKSGIKREIVGAYVLYPGRKSPHLYEAYRKTIKHEGIGAIPLLPGFEDELKGNLKRIFARHTPADHLNVATSVRGTSTVVGVAFSEASIPDICLNNIMWADFKSKIDSGSHPTIISLPIDQTAKIKTIPGLVRIKANNKAEVMVKVLHEHMVNKDVAAYCIEMTPAGFVQ